jgi:hypothetical protein
MSLMVAFMAIAALALSAKPPVDPKATSALGQLDVTLQWDTGKDVDVDLWVEGPDGVPVGYRHRTSDVFDLLHDHRGATVEGDFLNTEHASARHLPAGRYVVNAVLFNSYDHKFPVHVTANVERIRKDDTVEWRSKAEGDLVGNEQELTLIAFRLDDAGGLVPGSENNLPVCLWRAC